MPPPAGPPTAAGAHLHNPTLCSLHSTGPHTVQAAHNRPCSPARPAQVPAYKMAPGVTDMHLLRVCLRVGFDLEMADLLAHHIQLVSTLTVASFSGCHVRQGCKHCGCAAV